MPPRGYRDELKRRWREYATPEMEAQLKAASGRERDLSHLVRISIVRDRDGITPWAAAGKVADEIGGVARLRHANQKRLYGKFQKTPVLYQRLSLASDPVEAADREIWEQFRRKYGIK